MKIAVSGKGGVGKTTISANLVRIFAEDGLKVYAVDADPDVSLGTTLGFDPEELAKQAPLIDLKDIVDKRTNSGGSFYALNPKVDDIIEDYSLNDGNIKFLRMGAIKQGGSSCYCKENTFLHAITNSLFFDQDNIAILDMGAGIEHLTRGTSDGVDLMIIVTEPSKVSVETARVVKKLATDLKIKVIKIIGNRIRNEKELAFLQKNFSETEFLGIIPFDEKTAERAMLDDTEVLSNSDLLPGMKEISRKILEEVKVNKA